MPELSTVPSGSYACVSSIEGDPRLLARTTAIGIIPGALIEVVRNDHNRPMLVYSRDTLLALNKDDCAKITVQEVV